MPLPSKRGIDIAASPIRSLLPYADAAKREGRHIYHLNIGQPDIVTPLEAREYLEAQKAPIVKYGPSEGLPELRSAIATYYDKFSAGLTNEDVYVTTGASEAILFTLLSCCDPCDEVIIPEPFYANYLGFADVAQVDIVPISSYLEKEFSLPEPDEFVKRITSRTKAIFLCNPGNPTGQLYDEDQLYSLIQVVKKHNLFLIVDEVYREFCYDKAFKSVLAYEGIEEQVIVIDSISKVFSACGARVGCLITKNRDVQAVVNKYAQLRLCPPYHGQQLALACYQNPEPYISSAKEEYRSRRDSLYELLSEIEGINYYKPQAAFYNMIELPVDDAEAFCKWMLTDFEYQGATTMLAPASGFYFNQELGRKQVRLAYILNKEDLRAAIICLGKGLDSYKKLVQ